MKPTTTITVSRDLLSRGLAEIEEAIYESNSDQHEYDGPDDEQRESDPSGWAGERLARLHEELIGNDLMRRGWLAAAPARVPADDGDAAPGESTESSSQKACQLAEPEACANCHFRDPLPQTCRRYPPQITAYEHDARGIREVDTPSLWPMTEDDDWCGEWQPMDKGAPTGRGVR